LDGENANLVVNVEDDKRIVLVLHREILPPCLEARSVGDDVSVEAAVVVRLNHRIRSFTGDVVDLLGQIAKVGIIERASDGVGCEALHHFGMSVRIAHEIKTTHTEVQTEHVHALADELVDGLGIIPGVILVVDAREVLLAELSTRLVDAEPFQLSVCTCLFIRRGRESGADQRSRCENVAEEHGGR
jgi:hypothetical protein